MKPASLPVEIAGHPLVLSSLRAMFDPALRCLFVADAHFGKDAVFRARGVPVPIGSTADNLMRLDILIAEFEPAMLVFLGDLLHAREAHASETLDALRVWRARHAGLRVVLVEGNHDRHAGALPATLDVEYVQEPWRVGPWALCHHPQRVEGAYALGLRRATIRYGFRVSGLGRCVGCCLRSEVLLEARVRMVAWPVKRFFWWCRRG
jgi:DNA ligase-associated metallophosphoesterase